MAMYFIRREGADMRMSMKSWSLAAAVIGLGAMASGCATNQGDSKYAQAPEHFGQAVREDLAAQIADPDPAWKNTPPPPSSALVSALAMTRYNTDKVKVPQGSSTQTQVSAGGGGGGGGGGSSGGGGGTP
jgi:uncharacterized membrane protein YgcG